MPPQTPTPENRCLGGTPATDNDSDGSGTVTPGIRPLDKPTADKADIRPPGPGHDEKGSREFPP